MIKTFKPGDYILFVVCKKFKYPGRVIKHLDNGDYQIIASIVELATDQGLNLTEFTCSATDLEPLPSNFKHVKNNVKK